MRKRTRFIHIINFKIYQEVFYVPERKYPDKRCSEKIQEKKWLIIIVGLIVICIVLIVLSVFAINYIRSSSVDTNLTIACVLEHEGDENAASLCTDWMDDIKLNHSDDLKECKKIGGFEYPGDVLKCLESRDLGWK